jgi:hypothetical protein
LWTVDGITALSLWQVIMHPASEHLNSYKMVSDFVMPCVEQGCIIKFLVEETVKPAEFLQKLNAQNKEETLS